jgi:pimeloyl-ACP methyl ester carboxylesterase
MWKRLRYVVMVYALICGLYFTYQHLLYFQPKALDLNHVLTYPVQLRTASSKIPYDANTLIDVVKFKPLDSTKEIKGVVLFFHGNRFNVEHYSTYAPYFTRNGFEVWMPDYPGFGRSTGEIQMIILNELSVQLYKMARLTFEPDQIVIYGKSLGTGVASYLASVRDCRHLLLETPYYSLSSLTQAYLPFVPVPQLIKYNLKTGEYFKEIAAPITVLAAEEDKLIPLGNTLRLIPEMKNTDAFYVVKSASHNSLPASDTYHRILDSVLQRSFW